MQKSSIFQGGELIKKGLKIEQYSKVIGKNEIVVEALLLIPEDFCPKLVFFQSQKLLQTNYYHGCIVQGCKDWGIFFSNGTFQVIFNNLAKSIYLFKPYVMTK